VWGTFIIEAYRDDERREVYQALETLFGPESGGSWATAGIYIYWDFESRNALYVGLASDFAVRFGQHNGFRGCPASGCKRKEIDTYFASGKELLGLTVLPLSRLSQPSTARWDRVLSLEDRELLDLHEALSAEALDEIRSLEGKLIAGHKVRHGDVPPWNKHPGRLPQKIPSATDGTLSTATGKLDCLLQSRRTIRQLAADGEACIYEEHLHGARMVAVATGIQTGEGFRNDRLRSLLAERSNFFPGDKLLDSNYLDQRNPLTTGPALDPPEHDAGHPN
jgi:hypothetical protein